MEVGIVPAGNMPAKVLEYKKRGKHRTKVDRSSRRPVSGSTSVGRGEQDQPKIEAPSSSRRCRSRRHTRVPKPVWRSLLVLRKLFDSTRKPQLRQWIAPATWGNGSTGLPECRRNSSQLSVLSDRRIHYSIERVQVIPQSLQSSEERSPFPWRNELFAAPQLVLDM